MAGRKRIVIAGLGDTGVLAAIRLARHADVVGISTKPGLLSGQELGWRLSRPESWAHTNWIPFDRFRGLDRVRTVHASLTGVNLETRTVFGRRDDGSPVRERYDALVISTGVTNGFWRRPGLQSNGAIGADLLAAHDILAGAGSVMVIGGGAAAFSSAAALATTWPAKRVDVYFPGQRGLVHHHPRAWARVARRLADLGVRLHPGHRAAIPDGFDGDRITHEPVRWSTGQPPASADAVLWTVGRVRPNTAWLPGELLDERGFVRVTPDLRVRGYPGVFAVGDVAATDPLRSSARNRGDALLAHNIRAWFAGRSLRSYRPPARRWGSVLGVLPDGLEVYLPNGSAMRFGVWTFHKVLLPLVVGWGYYHGVRKNDPFQLLGAGSPSSRCR
ncbi:FAD-dependent oxidoreductase [Mycobacterium shimoidei]|uniref:FAD-dependent pyridine nucleotide-disulfide oxidoreductase [Gordonia sp. KTR9] n=1 Tax=Mycobacterium shimoidei TaxID=29313 RepID=A0A1E3TDZ2_MYCSH|nr:FAD-dependent oxidoreductase [Mycobacterium shimoidei]MCV7258398.1 FAD-dependent oxidoreductase [Mycobacterium shimoidei]ODR12647.1 pyridine nucleotide-disulfide oxidoreductase [Mycobacterium shimoidei]ORW81753.1 pyridine nucleotide-disulfide oxidoreductase [Mycobacterium shimoidei]SRX93741.1 FAD-dependent pyridine nucleotide-disulfide oxidoreductase [Gordonia sp. KTR9] [Mycobacterium shimoidei]